MVGSVFTPILQKLRELLLKFSELELPHQSIEEKYGLKPGKSAKEKEAEDDEAARRYNSLFREYVVQYSTFRKVGWFFIVALVGMVTITVCTNASLVTYRQKARWALAADVAVMLAAAALKSTVAPRPESILSIDYIGKHFSNLSYKSALRLANIGVAFFPSVGTILKFQLILRVWLSGYRYLLAVTDPNTNKVYFVSYGPVNSKTKFLHVLDPGTPQFLLDLGTLHYAFLEDPKPPLKMHLWIFAPTPATWTQLDDGNPNLLTDDVVIKNEQDDGAPLGFLLTIPRLNLNHFDKTVLFSRSRTRTGRIRWDVTPSPNTHFALRHFAGELVRADKIVKKVFRHGLDCSA